MRELVERFALSQRIDNVYNLSNFYAPTTRQKKLYIQASKSKGSFAKGWAHAFVSDKFGEATTHWRKLDKLGVSPSVVHGAVLDGVSFAWK